MRMQHDLFQTPNQVTLTIAPQPTPAAYKNVVADETMPMWRVQTEGYKDGSKQLIGLVSRDRGFLDSPDTEWISSGVNSKNPNAVAIGRHGNFLLWGFAASPTYLTEEAKLVFINAVHYIQRFDHQAPIARKRNGTSLRASVRSAIDSLSENSYARRLVRHNEFVAEDQERHEKVRVRIAAGEQVSKSERQMLDRPAPKPPGRFDSARRYFTAEQWQSVAGDEVAIRKELLKRLPFMRPHGWYEMVVDEDLVKLGVGNNDITMLDKAIATWAAGDDKLVMRDVLMRYTDQSFATVSEWQNWLASNRSRLFYTEAGGFKWLLNTLADAPSAASKRPLLGAIASKAARPIRKAALAAPVKAPSAANPLVASMRIDALAAGGHVVVIDVSIFTGWHAYDAVTEGSPYIVLQSSLDLPAGVKQVGAWQRPEGVAYAADPNVTVFEGQVSFRCKLSGCTSETLSEVGCELSFQVCNENMCQRPTSLQLKAGPAMVR
ncbi:MAG: hypothetical protein ACI8UD_003215 [Planctomycetota bacterium]|jgi:hypothetical protein